LWDRSQIISSQNFVSLYVYTTKDKYEENKENTVTIVDKKGKCNIESLQNESTKFLYQQRLNNKLNQNKFTDTEEM